MKKTVMKCSWSTMVLITKSDFKVTAKQIVISEEVDKKAIRIK